MPSFEKSDHAYVHQAEVNMVTGFFGLDLRKFCVKVKPDMKKDLDHCSLLEATLNMFRFLQLLH